MAKKNTNETLKKSWSSFDTEAAQKYLKGFGRGSQTSKEIMAEILNMYRRQENVSLVEFGCGDTYSEFQP